MNRTRLFACLLLAVLILVHESNAQCRRLCYKQRCVTYCRGRGKRSLDETNVGTSDVEKRAFDDSNVPSLVEERELEDEGSFIFD
uniref:Gomesin n=1 Tax=Acanthoscurria gomesiana TaxID=115339 RepID=GOME_ACAGO|nr:RecName: Full=Gomesin; Flags: Precursor [Acanthoscurria gomesiana]CAD67587.1 gomesin precursor [Acanthoscurria gomesiana]